MFVVYAGFMPCKTKSAQKGVEKCLHCLLKWLTFPLDIKPILFRIRLLGLICLLAMAIHVHLI